MIQVIHSGATAVKVMGGVVFHGKAIQHVQSKKVVIDAKGFIITCPLLGSVPIERAAAHMENIPPEKQEICLRCFECLPIS